MASKEEIAATVAKDLTVVFAGKLKVTRIGTDEETNTFLTESVKDFYSAMYEHVKMLMDDE